MAKRSGCRFKARAANSQARAEEKNNLRIPRRRPDRQGVTLTAMGNKKGSDKLSPKPKTILEADFRNIAERVKSGKPLTAGQRALVQAEASSGPTPKDGIVHSKADVARFVGVSRKTIDRWLKLPGAPKADDGGRYELSAWMRFRDAQGLGSADDSDHRSDNLALKNKKLKWEIGILEGTYVLASDVEAWLTERIERQKYLLSLKLKNEYPPKLAGLDAVEIAERMEKLITELCHGMQGLPPVPKRRAH